MYSSVTLSGKIWAGIQLEPLAKMSTPFTLNLKVRPPLGRGSSINSTVLYFEYRLGYFLVNENDLDIYLKPTCFTRLGELGYSSSSKYVVCFPYSLGHQTSTSDSATSRVKRNFPFISEKKSLKNQLRKKTNLQTFIFKRCNFDL